MICLKCCPKEQMYRKIISQKCWMAFGRFTQLFSVPPKFIDEGTSRDVIVKEGDSAQLTCQATGNPMPKIRWSREDGKSIRKDQKSK